MVIHFYCSSFFTVSWLFSDKLFSNKNQQQISKQDPLYLVWQL